MYELTVHAEFCAAHAITIAGTLEPTHGHNWRVTLTLWGTTLDADGLLCDFHAVEAALAAVTAPFQNADLNTTPPFDRVNPTAEHVARHIAEATQRALANVLPAGTRVASCRVTEAPGCAATYFSPPPPTL
ncbi:MAG: 6-carboxytetrahydropterin synthase [Planctomycetota bacterium]|nr:6-carboxytetrahydropterin synthase [Planctomycetota bacterium]